MAKWTEARDKAADRKAGIKEGSARDVALDRKRGLPPDVVKKGTGAGHDSNKRNPLGAAGDRGKTGTSASVKPNVGAGNAKKGGSHGMGCGCASCGAGRGVGLKVGSGADLSMRQRKRLPSSSFALPGKGEGPSGKGSGSYPIPDRGHAQAALSRVAQHGTPAEKATVRAKVKARFGMGNAR